MAGQIKKSVELFYDVISPYTWIGFEALCRYRQKWPIDLIFKPVLVGGLFQATGNAPPALNPVKGKYLMKDVLRVAKVYNLPFNHPKDFETTIIKKGSLLAMRLTTAVQINEPAKIEDISRELFLRVWSYDKDITEQESLLEACEKAGFSSSDAQTLVSKVKDQAVKDQLKANVQEALQHGAFGSPSMVVQGANSKKELLFGSDRFNILADLIGENELGPMNELSHPKAKLN